MKGVNAMVKQAFRTALSKAFPAVEHSPLVAASKFGDYQCNNALVLYKKHGQELGLNSSREAADRIAQNLDEASFSSIDTSPQGFVTVRVSPRWIETQLREMLAAKTVKVSPRTKLRVIVDFSSPNVAKEMHAGHLRSTIIGECICRVLEFVGHDVKRINHVGDWGTQFGMLIEHMKEAYPDGTSATLKLSDLQGFYRQAKSRFDVDNDFKSRSRAAVVALQGGDESTRARWEVICSVSRREFEKVYKRLDVVLEEVGESYYNDMLPAVIEEVDQKGLLQRSEGALCLFTQVSDVPLMVRKSDGAYGYDSTDLAALRHRLVTLRGDWLIYVTDLGQEDHFMKLFSAAEFAGWHKPPFTRCSHLGFGVVQGEDGKKFKTRSGDLVKLVDLLDEGRDRALAELRRRYNDEDEGCGPGDADILNAEERNRAAEAIGYSAVKYFDLKQNRTTDYKFSFDRMLDPKGNTAVYMMYAYARICAIFRKVGVDPNSINQGELVLETEVERKLALQLLEFPDVVDAIVEDLYPHRLAELMYKIATSFTEFYQNCKVIGAPQQSSRLLLCDATRQVLRSCFWLLGIVPLERI